MELPDLIKAYQTQVGLVDRIWWYFYSVTFAVLGVTILGRESISDPTVIYAICAGYAVFSVGSVVSLWKAQKDLCLFADKAKDVDSSFSLNPLSEGQAVAFQGIIVLALVVRLIKLGYIDS